MKRNTSHLSYILNLKTNGVVNAYNNVISIDHNVINYGLLILSR